MHHSLRHFAAVGALVLSACATPPETTVERRPVPILEAHHWHLQSATDGRNQRIDALPSRDGRELVFRFSGNRLDIQGACNVRGGSYQIKPAGLVLADRMATTMMACEPPLMQTDGVLSQLFSKPLQIDVTNGASPRLRLISALRDTLVFSGRPTPEARSNRRS